MYNTLKLMNACTSKQYLDTPFEELVAIYQQENQKDSVKSQIVRTVFCRLFPMLLKIQSSFIGIDNETKVGHSLSIIDYSLQVFGRTKVKCKFTTYLYNNFKNALLTEETKQKSKKRCVWRHVVKNNEDGTNYFITNSKSKNNNQKLNEFLFDLDASTKLSTEEKDYCKTILSGYVKSNEIEQQMNFQNKAALARATNPLFPKNIKTVNDLKRSIKQKFEKYGRELFYS